jgi:hypothetical protein
MCRQEIKYSSQGNSRRGRAEMRQREQERERERRAQEARRIIFGIPFGEDPQP